MSAEEILEDFEFLESWEERFRYIVELGRELPPMDAADKSEENRVLGCQSQVWITTEVMPGDPPRLHFEGDSDAQIVRGLVAIVFEVYEGKTPQEILAFDIHDFFARLDLSKHLTPSRSNGLNSRVESIRATAAQVLAHS